MMDGARPTLLGLCLFGCSPAPNTAPEIETPHAPPIAGTDEPAPVDDAGPTLVLHNPLETAITPYTAYLVDVRAAGPALQLWPNPYECPDAEPPRIAVAPRGGLQAIAAPSYAYALRGCDRVAPLPAGEYVVVVASGYGEELYATARVVLPLEKSARLTFETHAEWRCDAEMARRAARLAVASVPGEPPISAALLEGCDLDAASCGTTAVPPELPPDRCTVTLSNGWLRIDRPAGDDAPRWLTANVDREAVVVAHAEPTRTSASVVVVDGKPVRIAGADSHHMHEHGGDAARIYDVALAVDNPHARALKYRVLDIDHLADSQCGLPQESRGHSKATDAQPKTIAPGRSTLTVHFEPTDAYQGHCDRFATRVTLSIEGVRVRVSAEHQVTRIEPLHH